jgi:hypothetical protein
MRDLHVFLMACDRQRGQGGAAVAREATLGIGSKPAGYPAKDLAERFVQNDALPRHCEALLGAEAIQSPGTDPGLLRGAKAPLAMTRFPIIKSEIDWGGTKMVI